MKKIISLCLSIFILMMFATGCYAEPAENTKEPINQEIIVRINSPIITANGKDMLEQLYCNRKVSFLV